MGIEFAEKPSRAFRRELSAFGPEAVFALQLLRRVFKTAVLLALALWIPAGAAAGDRLPVFVSILPQKYFVEKIGGEFVEVAVMVQPGASPASYEPKPGQMVDLVKTRIYFAIGVPFESAWLAKISAVNPAMEMVHTEGGIDRIPMATAHVHEDAAASRASVPAEAIMTETAGDDDDHGGLDPHIWLSPPLVKEQVRTILAALIRVDPAHGAVYEANCQQFLSEIDALDGDLRDLFSSGPALRFMVFHPSWGYFARAYGLQQIAIEIEGKDPKPAQLKTLIEHAREEGIRVVFVQPQFSSRSADLIAREIDGRVAFADPLAEDWLGNLRQVAEAFKASMK